MALPQIGKVAVKLEKMGISHIKFLELVISIDPIMSPNSLNDLQQQGKFFTLHLMQLGISILYTI